MKPPEQRLFEADCQSAEFLAGVVRGRWGLASAEMVPETIVWPNVVVWLGAAPRPGAQIVDPFRQRPDRAELEDIAEERNAPVVLPAASLTLARAELSLGEPGDALTSA